MPTYDYVCEACSHEWELFQSMKDSPSKSCPKCKKRKARRRIGAGAGLIFKGTGFYETDYRSDNYKAGEKKAKDAAKKAKEKKSDSKKSESKKKSDSKPKKKT